MVASSRRDDYSSSKYPNHITVGRNIGGRVTLPNHQLRFQKKKKIVFQRKQKWSIFQTFMVMIMNTLFLNIQKKTFFLKKHDDESLSNTIFFQKKILDSKEKAERSKKVRD